MVFCKNCGNKLSEGARFCSVCGARVESGTEPAISENAVRRAETAAISGKPANRPAMTDTEWKSDRRQRRASSADKVTFDWSSVIDDSHRKVNENLRSPWESTGLKEEEHRTPAAVYNGPGLFETKETEVPERQERKAEPAPARRERTLTYIDILKQEKGLKNPKGTETFNWDDDIPESEPAPVLSRDEMEKTQGYEDLSQDIVSRLAGTGDDKEAEKPAAKEVRVEQKKDEGSRRSGSFDENKIPDFEEQLAYIRARRQARTVTPEPPRSFVESAEAEEKEIQKEHTRDHEEGTRSRRTAFNTAVGNGLTDSNSGSDIEDELAGILGDDSQFMDDRKEEVSESPVLRPAEETETSSLDDDLSSEFDLDKDIDLPEEEEPSAPSEEKAEEPVEEAYSDFEEGYSRLKSRTGRAARNHDVQALRALEDEEPDEDLEAELEALAPEFADEGSGETSDTNIDEYLTEEPAEDAEETSSGTETQKSGPASVSAPAEKAVPPEADKETEDEKVADLAAEIEALQKKLAQLTGTADKAEKVEEPEKTSEEVQPVAAEEVTAEEVTAEPAEAPEAEENEDMTFDSFSQFDAEFMETPDNSDEAADALMDLENKGAVEEYQEEVAPEKEETSEDAAAEFTIEEPETPAAPSDNEVPGGYETESGDLDIDKELAALGFDLGDQPAAADEQPEQQKEEAEDNEGLIFTEATTDTSVLPADGADNDSTMSIDELEQDIFGEDEDSDLEATRKIEKFYTLYRKNEEFQKLLDEEYQKLKAGSADYSLMDEPVEETGTENMYGTGATIAMEVAEVNKALEEAAGQQEAAEPKETEVPESKEAGDAMDFSGVSAETQAPAPVKEKAAPPVEDEDDDYETGKGGGVLTVIAIIVAVLLVILLVIILVLNFAPNSGVAATLNESIANLTKLLGIGQQG